VQHFGQRHPENGPWIGIERPNTKTADLDLLKFSEVGCHRSSLSSASGASPSNRVGVQIPASAPIDKSLLDGAFRRDRCGRFLHNGWAAALPDAEADQLQPGERVGAEEDALAVARSARADGAGQRARIRNREFPGRRGRPGTWDR
jgi:hypothetical protein